MWVTAQSTVVAKIEPYAKSIEMLTSELNSRLD